MAGDYDPAEILKSGIFALTEPSAMDDMLAGGLSGFGASLLLALIPKPEVLGGVIAMARIIVAAWPDDVVRLGRDGVAVNLVRIRAAQRADVQRPVKGRQWIVRGNRRVNALIERLIGADTQT